MIKCFVYEYWYNLFLNIWFLFFVSRWHAGGLSQLGACRRGWRWGECWKWSLVEDRNHWRARASYRHAAYSAICASHISWRWALSSLVLYHCTMCIRSQSFFLLLGFLGYYGEGLNAIIVFSACYLPDSSCPDYHYIMENLFLWVANCVQCVKT